MTGRHQHISSSPALHPQYRIHMCDALDLTLEIIIFASDRRQQVCTLSTTFLLQGTHKSTIYKAQCIGPDCILSNGTPCISYRQLQYFITTSSTTAHLRLVDILHRDWLWPSRLNDIRELRLRDHRSKYTDFEARVCRLFVRERERDELEFTEHRTPRFLEREKLRLTRGRCGQPWRQRIQGRLDSQASLRTNRLPLDETFVQLCTLQ